MQSIYRTIGDALVGNNRARFAVYRTHDDQIKAGVLNTGVGINDGGFQAGFSRRYGYSIRDEEGTLVGERLPSQIDVIQVAARHPFNPFGLIDNAHYVVTDQDMHDLKRFSADGHFTIWDSVLVGMIPRYLPEEVPPVVAPPTTPPTTPPTIPPKPIEPTLAERAYKMLSGEVAEALDQLRKLPAKGGGQWVTLARKVRGELQQALESSAPSNL